MKILVLGGSYFLGKHFVEKARLGHELYILNRGTRPLYLSGVHEIKGDRHEKESYDSIREIRFDAVVDFCAYTKGDIAFVLSNLTHIPQKYILISTVDIYQRQLPYALSEDAPLEERIFAGQEGAYIAGKVALEKELKELAKELGFCPVSLRPAFIYGPDNYAPREGVYFHWIQNAGQILHPKDATGWFQMVYVEDVAKAILICLEKEIGQEAYNLCPNKYITYDLWKQILEASVEQSFQTVELSVEEILTKQIPLPFPLTKEESNSYDGSAIEEMGFFYTDICTGMKKTAKACMKIKIEQILEQLDRLFAEGKTAQAGAFLENQYALACQENRGSDALTLLNELIGYHRVMTQYEKAEETIDKAYAWMHALKLDGTLAQATTFLNIATVYRAMGKLEEAGSLYDQTERIYLKHLGEEDYRLASFYNNKSLFLQEQNRYPEAVAYLEKALHIVEKYPDTKSELATTYANLGQAYLKIPDLENAEKALIKSLELYRIHDERDVHLSGCENGLGMLYYQKKEYDKSVSFYEKALYHAYVSNGKTKNYERIRNNLMQAYEAGGYPTFNKMLPLCRAYYEQYGRPMLEQHFPEYIDQIAVGLCGEGSECFGFDDEISKDHDCGPGFAIWISEELNEKIGSRLKEAYEQLPRVFAGEIRTNTEYGQSRTGVCTIDGFFRRVLGGAFVSKEKIDWEKIPEYALAAAVNGAVFTDPLGEFTAIRKKIQAYYPENIRLEKLARCLLLCAQSGQYNYGRMAGRNASVTTYLALAEFMQQAMQAAYLIKKSFAPYYKWMRKGLDSLEDMETLGEKLDWISQNPFQTEAVKVCIEEVAELLVNALHKAGLSDVTDLYLETQGKEVAKHMNNEQEKLIEEIVLSEWKAFDQVQNEGGRAGCQDDWTTFSIMRKSQYLTWEKDMLEEYLYYFTDCMQKGRNLITEKYGRMMESTAPHIYEQICGAFPQLSEQRKQIQEAIIAVQVSWMEEFAAEYPKFAQNARSIHTSEDESYNTSYETYLRGELSTYSDSLLAMYGRFIVSLQKDGKNLARLTMEHTVRLYGYTNLDEAAKNM